MATSCFPKDAPYFLKIQLILFFHLRLGPPSGFFPLGLPINTLNAPFVSPIHATCPAHLIVLDLITHLVSSTDHKAAHYVVFSTPLLPRPS